MDQLRQLEIALQQPDVRTNKAKLAELLHPQFIEVGYSGKTYHFQDIVDLLLAESQSEFKLWSQDFEFIEYASDLFQLMYRSARIDQNGQLSNHAKRTSIWVNESGNWQIKFHQATPIDVFEKLTT